MCSETARRTAWEWGEVLERDSCTCLNLDHCNKQPDCLWLEVWEEQVIALEMCFVLVATLAFFKSNLNITGTFNNYLSQPLTIVVFLPLQIPAIQEGFRWFCGGFFFSGSFFFHKPVCSLVVAMQGSLLNPRELFLLDMQMDPNPQNLTECTSLSIPCRGYV